MDGCEGGNVFDSFAALLRWGSRGSDDDRERVKDEAMKKKKSDETMMDECGRTVQLGCVADRRSDAAVPF
jgi:hypothetical protein